VVGYTSTTLSGNIAFAGISTNGGASFSGNDSRDGTGRTSIILQISAGFPAALTASPWTYEAGKLPGLGAAVTMPDYMKLGVEITIGGNTVAKSPQVGDILTARVNGITPSNYVWKFYGVVIGQNTPYTVGMADIGGVITLEITESTAIFSVSTKTVVKGKVENFMPGSPTLDYVTYSTIKLRENQYNNEVYEYGCLRNDTVKWQKSAIFNGLRPNTEYIFFQRIPETKSRYASIASYELRVSTLPRPEALIKVLARTDSKVQPDIDTFVFVPDDLPEPLASVIQPNRESAAALPSGEFTAGPNPVDKHSGTVNFYRSGKQIVNCELRIYDATGNTISRLYISDRAQNGYAMRQVGAWDLRDLKGRRVSEGTYLVRGVLKTLNGEREKVSLILGVR